MRKLLLFVWLLLPFPVIAYHLGPGQTREELDEVALTLAMAEKCVANEEWADAVDRYDDAIKLIPADKKNEVRRIRLEKARAQMQAKQLPKANADLQSLVSELEEDDTADPETLRQARDALANSQYYMTWLMRLEGVAREEWEPEIESARQTWKLLAEESAEAGQTESAEKSRDNLEAAIRLARLDLKDLQGLPLPSQ